MGQVVAVVKKKELHGRVEPYIYSSLIKDEYEIIQVNPRDLLSWNRLIVAFNLLYLDLKGKNNELAYKIYYEMVRGTSLGTFIEPFYEEKNSIEKFFEHFENIFKSLKIKGFDPNLSLIPLANNNTILNGSHRVACANKLLIPVYCVKTELEPIVDDYLNLFNRKVPVEYIEMAVVKFIEYSNNCYMAFLWPSSKKYHKKIQQLFSRVVYSKEIKLSLNGVHNLLIELYKHMDWVGTPENNFPGIRQKLVECFPALKPFKVVIFQEDSIEKVRYIKEQARAICNIGYSAIHITDTIEETLRIAKLLLGDNQHHFLNFAKPFKYQHVQNDIENIKVFLSKNNIDFEDIVVDGSLVLALYGIRKNKDVDLLVNDIYKTKFNHCIYNLHDNELKWHGIEKRELLYNPKYFFYYSNIKFVSFLQLYNMKKNRNEAKDRIDLKLMQAYLSKDNFRINLLKLRQSLSYFYIKSFFVCYQLTINMLKIFRIYPFTRKLYKKFTKNKTNA